MAESPNILLKFPQGIDNRSREYALQEGTLREAVNLDITRDGGLLSRLGTREVFTGNFHSLYTPSHGRFMLAVKDGTLSRLNADETITSLVEVAGRVNYALLNDQIFWTDSSQVGRITSEGTASYWGMAQPPAPQVTSVATGGLFVGTYQVAMAAVNEDGLESGVTEAVEVTVVEGGGIQVATPSAGAGLSFAFYRTPANGSQSELRQAAIVAPGVTVILGVGYLGKALESLNAQRPLPGQCLIAHKGRLWVASGNVVWFTSERSPHWLFPATGYYQFETVVQGLAATEDGLYVGLSDRIYYLQGNDPYKMTQRPVSSVGMVQGSPEELPYDLFLGEGSFPSRQTAWWDRNGLLCVGKAGGIIVRPGASRFSADVSGSGASAYRQQSGLRQWISVLNGSNSASLQSTPVSVAEVFTQGVVLGAS